MLEELFIRGHAVNAFVRLDGIVEVNEPQQADLALFAIPELLLCMPHLHERPDHPLGLAIGLGTIGAGELLSDTILAA